MSKDFLFVRELIHSFELICYHQKIYMWVKIMCKISDFRILISAYICLRTLQDLHCIFIRTKLFRYLVYLGKIKGKQISTKHENFAKRIPSVSKQWRKEIALIFHTFLMHFFFIWQKVYLYSPILIHFFCMFW